MPFVFQHGKPACDIEGIDSLLPSIKPKSSMSLNERIEALLKSAPVLLFMKGTPDGPQCGFSSRIVAILKQYDGLDFKHFNIFEDNEIREGLKKYSNWPTYP